MDKYVIITVAGCPWCSRAIALAENQGYSYEVKKMSWGPELREIQSNHHGWKTVPMIFKYRDGVETFIGGYTELQSLIEVEKEHAGQEKAKESQR